MDDTEATTAAVTAAAAARELVACWGTEASTFPLSNRSFILGRSETCDVHLPHASVSRRHARLDVDDGGLAIEDLGGTNGVKIDGAPLTGEVRRAKLELGSLVELGSVRLVVRAKDAGADSPMVEVRRVVEKAARSPLSLILVGETGVGKEVLTEAIHRLSGRTGPLVRLNCAGLTATLLESELFGYERGAFTGAVQAKPGLIETAQGGTLFLDELGEMPESTQAKLLRVLESREVRRIGALTAKPIDVRFVSATHKDLRALAVMGRFREDLLFRLNGLTVRIPPLRARRDEILALAGEFLRSACAQAARPIPSFSEGARALLESYRWPGNVRELRNVIHRFALLTEDPIVRVEHLDFDPAHALPTPSVRPPPVAPAGMAASESVASAMPTLPAPPSLAPPGPSGPPDERETILAELAKVGGNQAAAAKAMGLTPRVLAYRMDKLGLPRPRRGQ